MQRWNYLKEIVIKEKMMQKSNVKNNEKEALIRVFQRMQNGDADAFNDFYMMTEQYMHYVANINCSNKNIIEDIVQEAYLDVYRKCQTLKDLNAIKSWLGVVVRNRALELGAKESKTVLLNDESDFILDEVEESDHLMLPAESMDDKETQRLIANIIDQLPYMQKMAIIECEYNNLKTREVAELYGISENTVKSNRRYAKAFIKKEVEKLAKEHNTKLYSVSMAPVLYLVLRNSIAELPKTAMAPALKAATISAATTTAGTATKAGTVAKAGTTAKAASAKAVGTKILAGVVGATVIGSGVAANNTYKNSKVKKAVETIEEAFNEHDNDVLKELLAADVRTLVEQYEINIAKDPDKKILTFLNEGWGDDVIEFNVIDIDRKGNVAYVSCECIYDRGYETTSNGILQFVNEEGWKLELDERTQKLMVDATSWNMDFDLYKAIINEFDLSKE